VARHCARQIRAGGLEAGAASHVLSNTAESPVAKDTRISDIFYHFEHYTSLASGRTVGRKIGVVQEILCKKLLQQSERVRDCVLYERPVLGLSGASHKVEFVLYQATGAHVLAPGEELDVGAGVRVVVLKLDTTAKTAKLKFSGLTKNSGTVREGTTLVLNELGAVSNIVLKTVAIAANRVRLSVLDTTRPVAMIESKRVGAQRFSGSDKLGSGIQTIEKAKQAALVAIDTDLRYNRTFLALTSDGSQRQFKSVVVLGNGVHWTDNDLAILGTYVDYTYLAEDAAIIRYADFVKDRTGTEGAEFLKKFLDYFDGMTKTPDDAFTVTAADFRAIRPDPAPTLLEAVEAQIQEYPVTSP
jgi:hypothetical protein